MIRELLSAREDSGRIAVITAEKTYTYGDLMAQSAAVRARLPVPCPKHAAIYLPNGGDYIAAFWGVLMAGLTAFPLNVLLTGHEIGPLLVRAGIQIIITSQRYRPLLEEVAVTMAAPLDIICMEELTPVRPAARPVPVDMEETMVLLATSGTTGKAKIVQLTETNVESCVLAYLDKMDFEKCRQEEVRIIPGTPFTSVYGIMILCACLYRAFSLVVLAEPFTLDMAYRAIETYRVTHYEGGPAFAQLMAQTAGRPIAYDISSLGYVGFGGSKVAAATFERLYTAYPGVVFWPGYGMTEASPLIAKPDKRMNMDKLEAVGTAVKGMVIMVESDGVRTSAPYVRGEIVVCGPNVMKGYYDNDEETRKILKDGFLHTGDLGYLDEDGYLYICGRLKNVIMARGFSVHAEEVEVCIKDSGLVRDCVVYGETDSLGNERVCADIVPLTPGIQAAQVFAYCKGRLSGYKQPQKIRIVETIKKTVTDKSVAGPTPGKAGQVYEAD